MATTPLASGTSFPVSPSDGDWFFRTDRNVVYFYKNSVSRWLTVDLKYVPINGGGIAMPSTTNGTGIGWIPWAEDGYIENWITSTYVTTTNNASNYWPIQLLGNSTTVASFDTSADTASTRTAHITAIGSLITTATYQWLEALQGTKTGTPGSLYAFSVITYRPAG